MANLFFNEIFLSIFSKDDYFSLAYYSFNDEGLFFKDKFSDNTLNNGNLISFVRQLKPTLCVMNYGTKNELYYQLVDTLNELFILDRIDDFEDEDENSLTTTENDFTSIRHNIVNTKTHQSNLISPDSNLRNRSNLNNQINISNSLENDRQISSLQNDAITTTVNLSNSRVILLTNKFYNSEACKKAIFDCDYHQNNIFTENDKRVFIASLINLNDDNDFLLKSIGALLIYINQNKFNNNTNGKGLSIKIFEQFKCESYVNIDQVTLNELNVFSSKDHPSIFKKDSKKDESSLFSLFNRCKSNCGSNFMRKLFFQPINCYQKLNNRLDDIEQIIQMPKDVLYFYYSCLKKIKSINGIVEKMKIMTLNYKQYLILTTTIDNLIAIHQYVLTQQVDLKIYNKIKENYPIELEQIVNDIKVVIDLERSAEVKRIEINFEINEELDKMKQEFENIEEILSIATEHEKNSKLIDYMPNFQIIFSPLFGFVIQVYIKDLIEEKKMLLTLRDIDYISTTDKFKYFKTKNLKKYDESYSDLLMEISCKQNAILLDLQNGILNRVSRIFKFFEIIGELDCLLRFAQIAKLYGYTRPKFNFRNSIDIRNGRHPLRIASDLSGFVPNDYSSEYPRSIKLLTGANNSGKTVYLKQNCLIIYMAYLGSFVPADSCNIPLFSKILTKIETIESMSTGISSFTNDLCRLSNIICKIPYNSLVVIDEFGKGTNFEDGLSIFSAYINHIIEENPKSHFIISTHIHSLPDFLRRSSLNTISYQQMEVKFENNEIFYTYKLIDGFAEFSFPLELGKKIKFDPLILIRANNIRELYKNGGSFKEMAAYTQNELEKVNRVLEQIVLIKRMIKSSNETTNNQDNEMDHSNYVEENEPMN